eukprot:25027_1
MATLLSNLYTSFGQSQQQSKRCISENIIKRGWFQQQSRYFNTWHKVYVILTVDALYIFNNQQDDNATELINLEDIASIKSPMDTSGTIIINKKNSSSFTLKTKKIMEINHWMSSILAYMNLIEIPITINCNRKHNYSYQFQLKIPYHSNYDYTINTVIQDIIQCVNKKHNPIIFVPILISSNSFMGQQIYYDDY